MDAKICHCTECRILHGAPMQWAAIFRKSNVRLTSGRGQLAYYNSALNRRVSVLPCKVSCAACGTLIADEGRNMWLAFPRLFDFGSPPMVPEAFKSGPQRMFRGGSWANAPEFLRSAYRVRNPPDYRFYTPGFRLAITN